MEHLAVLIRPTSKIKTVVINNSVFTVGSVINKWNKLRINKPKTHFVSVAGTF